MMVGGANCTPFHKYKTCLKCFSKDQTVVPNCCQSVTVSNEESWALNCCCLEAFLPLAPLVVIMGEETSVYRVSIVAWISSHIAFATGLYTHAFTSIDDNCSNNTFAHFQQPTRRRPCNIPKRWFLVSSSAACANACCDQQ